MSNNKGQAITRNIFRPGGRSGTEVCGTTLLLAVGFVVSVLAIMGSSFASWYGLNTYNRPAYSVVAVNAPDTFIQYYEANPPGEDSGYGIIFEEWPALYDFLEMSDLMHGNDAGLCVVFPEDFDSKIRSGETAEILTYYRTDTLYYKEIRDNFSDTYLAGYKDCLASEFGEPDAEDLSYNVIPDYIPTSGMQTMSTLIAKSMGSNFIPILLFIVLLFAAMSSGTESIAGQKERGTFSRIILTPVPRRNIITSFINGVFLSSILPAAAVLIITFLIPWYRHLTGAVIAVILVLSLAYFISSLTVLISVMNNSVTSAQTAFLPVFFILVTVGVTCISNDIEDNPANLYLPVYGHFYGIGEALNGEGQILPAIICSASTVILGLIVVKICTKLLSMESFTVPAASGDNQKPREETRLGRVFEAAGAVLDVILYPLALLSVFQLLAMIPVIAAYMRDPAYSDFILELQNVTTINGVIGKTMEIIGIFMNDPRFLSLMTISYILIIICCIRRVKGASNLGLSLRNSGRFYGSGCLLGIIMMSAVFAALCITGNAAPQGFGISRSGVPTFIFSILMWIPQGASEEVMFRGYMIPKLKKYFGAPFAVFFSSLLFAVFHSLNDGFTVLALVNIFLLAVLFALIYEKTGSLLITCAAHTMWNMFQGNVYGLSVSGNAGVPSLISVDYSGSAFGPEGTPEATLVIVIALAAFVFIVLRKRSCRKA